MSAPFVASRRALLTGSAALGLVIGFRLPLGGGRALAQGVSFVPNAFLRIAPDSTVTILSKHIEFGQGPYTGIATILADELDADWSQMRAESAPADLKLYGNLAWGGAAQGTGGSSAMANSWDQLRQAGAQARARLVFAAAASWKVRTPEITIEKGVLKHPSGKTATFGEMAERAQAVKLLGAPKPKDPSQWVYIGKHVPKLDTRIKTTGEATFTIDIKLPDMLTCLIARPPRFGAKAKAFDPAKALAIAGVREVFAVPQGVAVLAEGFWAARKGRDSLAIDWDQSGTEGRGSKALFDEYRALAKTTGKVARGDGDAEATLAKAAKVIEATFTFPYLAHAPLEPNDCVIRRTDDGGAELMLGSQIQSGDQAAAAEVLGLKPEQVAIKTMLAGGSFGRRATPNSEVAREAAEVAKAMKHKGPVKLIWTREDDIKGGRYRPIYVHRLRGALDAAGNIVAWDQVVVGQSIMTGTPFEAMMKDGIDPTMTEGAATLPYAIPNLRVSVHVTDVGVPVLWWRSVGHTHTGYSTETFLDELAEAAGVDPLAIRQRLLTKHPRHLGVLNLAAGKAGWGAPLPEGRARGLAVHESFNSFVAQVVEVSMGSNGLPKVERVVCAVDCGIPINPDIIKAQMEGGIGYGLSATLFGAIDLDQGAVQQSNFHDYRVLRINEMPTVEVHIVPSTESPTGVGEPGVPPIGPAVANAWAKLTGQRVRDLPFSRFVPGV